jgi:hypothetical protein
MSGKSSSGKSSAELELEAEAARARMAETASTIRSKLTAGQVLDEVSGMVTGGDLSQGLSRLKTQIRDNPLPLTLIGAGIALLAFGPRTGAGEATGGIFGGGRSPRGDEGGSGSTRYGGADRGDFTDASEGTSPHPGGRRDTSTARDAEAMRNDHEGLADKAGQAARAAPDGRRAAPGWVRSAARGAGERVGDGADHLLDTANRLGHEMLSGATRRTRAASAAASDVLDQEPLALGALGLVLGAVLGGALPVSEFEEEHLGPHARKLREGAERLAKKGLKGAGEVASKTFETVREEADRQGLTLGDGETLSARAGEVAKAAAETVSSTLRSEFEREGAATRPDQS